jgi:Carbohydrate-selective porin, OprB family/S-layer homology domain
MSSFGVEMSRLALGMIALHSPPQSPPQSPLPPASLDLPEVSAPETPATALRSPDLGRSPTIHLSQALIPDLEWSEASASDLTAPDLTAPDLTAPDLTAPALTAPDLTASAVATPKAAIPPDPTEPNPALAQILPVHQFTDVTPTTWAYGALQSLHERHGCISGYPDGSFRGDRSLSRFEFAAGLQRCLVQINERLQNRDLVTVAELEALRQLQVEFASELKTLQGRADLLEVRSSQLESQAFSTTTKLFGQVTGIVQGSNQPDIDLFPRDGQPERQGGISTRLGYIQEISLATSFRGNDLLLTTLTSGNLDPTAPNLFSTMGRLASESSLGGAVALADLSYRFPVTNNFGLLIGAVGVNPENTFRGINPLEGYAQGALSLFGQRNPILGIGNSTAGVGFDWQISRRVSLQGLYGAQLPALVGDAKQGGLFGGRTTVGAQLSLAPTDTVNMGIHYLYTHSPNGDLGGGVGDAQLLSPFAPTEPEFNTHALGATLAWRVTPQWSLGTWGGWTVSTPEGLAGRVETTNWMVFSAFSDLAGRGNLGGLMLGQPPKISHSSLPNGYNFPNFGDLTQLGDSGGQRDSSLHLEAFFRWQLTPRLALTPGCLVVFNPNHNRANDTLVMPVLRATFQF